MHVHRKDVNEKGRFATDVRPLFPAQFENRVAIIRLTNR